MTLEDLGLRADHAPFTDMKSRLARDYDALRLGDDEIMAQVGRAPTALTSVTVRGVDLALATTNTLEWEFSHHADDLDIHATMDAHQELCAVIWETFPIAAFTHRPEFSIGFLQEVSLRGNLYRITPVETLAEHEGPPLITVDGQYYWSFPVLQSVGPRALYDDGLHHYRFVFSFMNPGYGFIDFDQADAIGRCAAWRMVCESPKARAAHAESPIHQHVTINARTGKVSRRTYFSDSEE